MSGRITPELSVDETHTLLSTTSNSKQQQQQQHPVVQQQVNTSKAAFFLGLPTNVKLILFNELTERFAYYGNRAILTLFLTHINFDDAKAVMVYSLSSAMAYTMPLFGGYLADAWLGRYWTIVIFSMVYFFGALLLALAAVPSIWDSAHDPMLVYIALTLTAFGTGGIKANVSTFGGEQLGFVNNKQLQKKNKPSPDGVEYAKFKNIEDDDEEEEQYGDQQQEEEQQHNITPQMTSESFFYMFYFTMNIGSIGATILIPLIRTHVSYFWAFLLPAGFMLLSVVILLIGLVFKQFHLATPDGGVVVNSVFTVIYRAFKRRKWLYQDYLIPLPQGFAEQMAKRYANTTQPDLITVDRTVGGQDHPEDSRGEVVEAVVNVHDFTRFVHLNYDFILRHHYHNHTAEFDYDKPSWLLQAYTPGGGGGDLTTGSTTTMTTSSCCVGGDGHDTLPTVHSSINAFETTAGSPRDRPQRFTNKSPIATVPKINYGGVCQCESGCSCSCCESKQQTPNGTLKTTPYQTATGGNLSTMAPAYDLRSNADAPCRCNHNQKKNNNKNNNTNPDDDRNINNDDENNAALLFSGPASGPYGQGIKHPYEINQNIQKDDLKATNLYYYDQEDEETAQSSPNMSNSSSQNLAQQNFYQQHASFGQKVEDFDANKSCLGKFFSFVFCCCSRQYRRLNEVVSVLDITSDEYNVLDHLSPEVLKSKNNFNRKNNNNNNNNNNNIPQGVISIDDLHFPLYYDSNDQPDYLNTSKKYQQQQQQQDKSSTTTPPSNQKITYSIINSIRICLVIIPVLCTLPVFWSLMNQQGSTWMVQAEEMKLKFEISLFGKTFSPQLEPEQMSLLNPIFLAVFLPVLEYFLRINHSATTKNNTNNDDEQQDENEESKKKNVEDDVFETKTNNNKKESWFASPLNKIFLGMMFAAIAYIFAAGVDIFIQRGKDATPPYKINIMWQSFQYFFVTMAEVMISVTGLNFVFDMAPSNVKSLVTALYLFSSACGDLLTGILYSTFETWGFTREMMFYGFAVLITVNSAGVFVIKYVYEALYKQQLAIANNY